MEIGVGIGSNSGSANYKYKYQGQERQEELGLNWDSFKWRNYMPDIGRFFNVDPLAEDYSYQSPYNFSENRVVDAFELEGLEAVTLKTVLEFGNSNTKGLQAVRTNREYINSAANHYGVSAQAIGSIIFQEKSAGIRGDIANALSKGFIKNGTTSLGLGEIQVDKVAELRGLDADKDFDKIVGMLEDPKTNIDLIAENIADMQNSIGRELSVSEVTYGHNAGKENLKSQLSKGEKTTNRVSSRSSNMQGAIKDALKGKNDERSDKQRDADNTVKKDPLQYRGFYENQGSKL